MVEKSGGLENLDPMNDQRIADTVRFYDILDCLAERVGGPKCLKDCDGRMGWPERGLYFFFEKGEVRAGTGGKGRVVRVGTHAIDSGAGFGTKLWKRLYQHRGFARSGLGNHRSSIFRETLGPALAKSEGVALPPYWGKESSYEKAASNLGVTADAIKESEEWLEKRVSEYIGGMPFLWLNVDGPRGPNSKRAFIESNAIALLSGYRVPSQHGPSEHWIGHQSKREVARSGLWNDQHVSDATYDLAFLDELASRVETTLPIP